MIAESHAWHIIHSEHGTTAVLETVKLEKETPHMSRNLTKQCLAPQVTL